MRFSQRMGITPSTKLSQRESIDDDLKNTLWSVLSIHFWSSYRASSTAYSDAIRDSNMEPLMQELWLHYFKLPVDTIDQHWNKCLSRLRAYYFSAEWHQIFDFIEFIANACELNQKDNFIEDCNFSLARENSAYRFVNGALTEITSEIEIEEVELAITKTEKQKNVRTHLKSALAHLSSRTNPDYRNSIKESISAVEALAKKISGNTSGTLGEILKEMEKSKKLHPALKTAFSALYGYTSDADGIRHALLAEQQLTKADAKFMLVCCATFINYVTESTIN